MYINKNSKFHGYIPDNYKIVCYLLHSFKPAALNRRSFFILQGRWCHTIHIFNIWVAILLWPFLFSSFVQKAGSWKMLFLNLISCQCFSSIYSLINSFLLPLKVVSSYDLSERSAPKVQIHFDIYWKLRQLVPFAIQLSEKLVVMVHIIIHLY